MRTSASLASLTLLAATALTTANAQAPTTTAAAPAATPSPTVAASSFASTEVRLSGRYVHGKWFPAVTSVEGPARVKITYGQPHARGRDVPGKVVPLDTVWRLGANAATLLHTDVDLMIGGTRVPHGMYSLWALPTANGWQLIINKEINQFGTTEDYSASADLARIPLRTTKLNQPIESLSMYLIPNVVPKGQTATPSGTLKIVWGTTELTTDWTLADWTKAGK